MKKNIFVIIGTRPEALKLFPVVNELNAQENLRATVCVTAQHRDLLDPILALTKIKPDFDLDIMKAEPVAGSVERPVAAGDRGGL